MKLVTTAFLCLSTPLFAQDVWTLDANAASCLLSNAHKYSEASGDPIVIFVKACPIVDKAEAIRSLQQNSALPSLKETGQDGPKTDDVVVFTRKELQCLATLKVPDGAIMVAIPKNPNCSG